MDGQQAPVLPNHDGRLTGMPADYFDRARLSAATGMFIAGVLAVVGSALDWVTVKTPPRLPDEDVDKVRPFTGLDIPDGWWVMAAGIALALVAVLLVARKRGAYAWLGFAASTIIGAIAIADFRGISDTASSLARRADVVGDMDPAIGIILVAAAAVGGLVASIAGVAASPRHQEQFT